MSLELRSRIFDELNSIPFIDPHTHINALNPTSKNLADILGYHYYTELAHSAGLQKSKIENDNLSSKELVATLVDKFDCLNNTIQYSW
ncbi:amidohydrolase, partial [bacterium]|nr:amidohydrolase [bacterium]